MPEPITFFVDIPNLTLERFLRQHKGVSHRMLTRLKRTEGGIRCNGKPIRTIDTVQVGDEIVLSESPWESRFPPSDIAVPILGESASYLLYDKPPHMPVHPSHGHYDDTLGNVFTAAFPDLPFRAVYRLDRDTSGICLIAKSAYAAKKLQSNLQKRYCALVCGVITAAGTVDAPIARTADSVITRHISPEGKPAVTHYQPLGNNGTYTLLTLWLETGRTHQIRVHMAHIGHPLAGDSLYGGDCTHFQRHMLHCTSLTFSEPDTGACITVESPPEAAFLQGIQK